MSSILFYNTRKSKIFRKNYILKKWTEWRAKVSQCRKTEWPVWGFSTSILSQNIKKLKWENFYFRKKSHSAEKKLEGGTLWDFPTSILSQNSKKVEGGDPLKKKKFREKSLAVPKKIGRGDPLVSPGMVWYAGKQEKPFWFSSLDQIVHFGPIIFCRTFKNYFGQFVWIEKKKRKVTIIVAFHFMKRRLKNC